MKRINSVVVAAVLAATALVSGCASDKVIDGVQYEPYGLLNKDEVRKPCVQYKLSKGNVVWSVLLVESVAVPVWLLGFAAYEPVGAVPGCKKE